MPARRILQLGDPMLRWKSETVRRPGEAALVVRDLRATLHEFQRAHGFGRGISAIQIGVPLRLIYIEFEGAARALVNPEWEWMSEEKFVLWDDCFSFPNLMVKLQRSVAVRLRYHDANDEWLTLAASGALSELLQHEMDHQDGVLAVDRALDGNSLATRDEWERRVRGSEIPVKKWLWLTAALSVIASVWLLARRTAPPEAPFTRVGRERLVSALVTNGKAEPIEWTRVRTERSGAVRRLAVERGSVVAQGQVLAELDASAARAELAAAEARITQAQSELETMDRGGREAERADMDGQQARARLELQQAEKEAAALARLAEKNAATRQEASEARDRVERLKVQIQALAARREALVTPPERKAAEARLRDAQAGAELARKTIDLAVIRAPMAGVAYRLSIRAGAYLNPGDEIAEIGRLDRLRITVYVDEPELGRVARGMPVTVTWDALPGREWKGTVEKTPATVTALGTREVGEVACVVENPGRELPPGANINASILSRVAENALVIPKEALWRENDQPGVYILDGNRVAWRPVETGISSVTRVQVLKGLNEGDAVATASEVALRAGLEVRPSFR